LLSGLLRRAEDSGGLTPWEVALAYGDSRGDAEPLLAAQLSNHPNDVAALFGRALLRRMQGRNQDALSDAGRAEQLAHGARGAAGFAEFLGETCARLGRNAEAVQWYRVALDAPNAPKAERGFVAYRAALVLRDGLHREAEAAELMQRACSEGNPQACLEAG